MLSKSFVNSLYFFSGRYSRRRAIINSVSTSLAEPCAIDKKFKNSFSDFRPAPSAIFAAMERLLVLFEKLNRISHPSGNFPFLYKPQPQNRPPFAKHLNFGAVAFISTSIYDSRFTLFSALFEFRHQRTRADSVDFLAHFFN